MITPEIANKENIIRKSNRAGNPNWHKGMKSPNPHGNTHTKDIAGLIDALEDKSKKEGYKNFDALVADRAMKYKEVLIAVMKKVYPEQLMQPVFNIYTQIWNSLEQKAKDVENNGRVHIGNSTEVQA